MEGVDLVEKAKKFATHAHEGQVRNDEAKTPYILHPQEVASLVAEAGGTWEEIAAAWLHDTVEDTPVTLDDVKKEFGKHVAELVYGLTDLPEFEQLPLAARKAKQAERVSQESRSVKLIKLADQTSNVQIVGKGNLVWGHDHNLTYIHGAKAVADVCKGVSPFLEGLFIKRYEIALRKLTT